jgi:hypothetical protein
MAKILQRKQKIVDGILDGGKVDDLDIYDQVINHLLGRAA